MGLKTPSPPYFVGKAKTSRRSSLNGCPIMVGRNSFLIAFSIGRRSLEMLGVVRIRYIHLLHNPKVYAEKASWCSCLASSVSSLSSSIHDSTLFLTCSSMNCRVPMGVPRYLSWPWVVMLTPGPEKSFLASSMYSGLTISHDLEDFGKYPYDGPTDEISSHHF